MALAVLGMGSLVPPPVEHSVRVCQCLDFARVFGNPRSLACPKVVDRPWRRTLVIKKPNKTNRSFLLGKGAWCLRTLGKAFLLFWSQQHCPATHVAFSHRARLV